MDSEYLERQAQDRRARTRQTAIDHLPEKGSLSARGWDRKDPALRRALGGELLYFAKLVAEEQLEGGWYRPSNEVLLAGPVRKLSRKEIAEIYGS